FAFHLQFLAARADCVRNTAPNSVMHAIPKVAFQITTNGGAPLAVDTATVDLDGIGWVDVSEVESANPVAPVPLAWVGQTTWHATLPLVCGDNVIELDAFDRHGQPVGSDSLSVTRAGAGCP